jgi:Na+/proline symporter
LWGLRIGTIISFTAFCAVIFLTDPLDIGNVAFILFYLTFFLTVSGFGVLMLTWLWHRMTKDMLTLGEIGMAVRQGVLIGAFITILVGMQQMQVLLWWDVLIVLGIVFLIELYFLTK